MEAQHQPSPQRQRRRRGARLEADIFAATLAEMRAIGYSAITFDGVARRAGIGRMSLYRRWETKPQLVAAALRHALPPETRDGTEGPDDLDPGGADSPNDGDLRGELLTVLASMFRADDDRPVIVIEVAASLLTEHADEALATIIREEILNPRLARLQEIFERAQERRVISRTANTMLLARSGPAVLFQQILLTGTLPTIEDITQVVDGLIVPAASMS